MSEELIDKFGARKIRNPQSAIRDTDPLPSLSPMVFLAQAFEGVTMWRQGDVLIQAAAQIPEGARARRNLVLAEGEKTGHMHQVAEKDSAELFEKDGVLYLSVKSDSATVVHQEHKPITLKKGLYKVWQQREYSPKAIRTVMD